MDKALAEGQPAANWHAYSEATSFERKESPGGLASGQDGNVGIRPDTTYGAGELRRQERIGQGQRGILHRVPCRDLGRAQFVRADEMYCHRIVPCLPGLGRPGSRFIRGKARGRGQIYSSTAWMTSPAQAPDNIAGR